MDIPTGRFYKPKDLSSVIYPLSVIPGYLRKKRYYKKIADDTFNIHLWINEFIQKNKEFLMVKNDIFMPFEKSGLNDYDLANQVSLRLWYSTLMHK